MSVEPPTPTGSPMPLREDAVHPGFPTYTHWVEAWPFRCHVLHVATEMNLPWRVVPLVAGSSPAVFKRLPTCRPRRGRLHAADAAALYVTDAGRVRRALAGPTEGERAAAALRTLIEAGRPLRQLVEAWRLDIDAARTLLRRPPRVVAARWELLAAAEIRRLGLDLPWVDGEDASDVEEAA